MALSDSRRGRRSWRRRGRYPRLRRVSPDYPRHPSSVLCPLPRRIERVLVSITSPFTRPSPHFGRVGIRIMDFEACSGFTRVTARWIARPPEAAFVTRLRPVRLPVQAARQLPDQSTTLWAEPSSAGDTRLRGAPKRTQFVRDRVRHRAATVVSPRGDSDLYLSRNGERREAAQSKPIKYHENLPGPPSTKICASCAVTATASARRG